MPKPQHPVTRLLRWPAAVTKCLLRDEPFPRHVIEQALARERAKQRPRKRTLAALEAALATPAPCFVA